MAAIKGVNVVAPVVPLDTADVHPSHEARYGKGGYRTVATTAERDAIPAPRREAGMLVYVVAGGGSLWQLGADLTTWTQFSSSGGGVSSWNDLTDRPTTFPPSAHGHDIADVSGLQTALNGKQASGTYATLVGGKVPAEQLPSYVDDVIEAANLAALPATGAAGVIYVALDTNKVYRWSGSAYVEVSAGASAWADITGKPSAFAPESHAASHLFDGGNDPIFDQDLSTNAQPQFGGLTIASDGINNIGIIVGDPPNNYVHLYVDSEPGPGHIWRFKVVDGVDGAVIEGWTIDAGQVTGLATVATSGAYGDLTDLPTLFDGAYGSLTGLPTLGTAASQDSTAFAAASHAHAWSDITSGVPSTFAPSAHNHAASEITSGTLSESLLPTSGVAAGTYTSVTVDTYGRVTAGSSPSIAYSSLTGLPTLGTAASQDSTAFATASHSHGSVTSDGRIGSTSGQIVVTGTGGALTTAATIASSSVSGLGGSATLNVGTTAGTVAAGDDARLSDARTPTAHNHAASDINSGVIATARLASSGTASSTTFLRGDSTWAAAGSTNASDLTSGTLAYSLQANPTVTSPSQITSNQNDYASFARGINRFTTNAARDITGMVAGNDGEVRVLCNTGTTAANTLTIKDESSSSTAANRFSVPWNGDCVIPAEGSVVVFYDGTSSRWRVV